MQLTCTTPKLKADPLNSDVDVECKTKVIELGGSCDAIDLLNYFLDRELNNNAFLKNLYVPDAVKL